MKKLKALLVLVPVLLILLSLSVRPVSALDTGGTLPSGHTWTYTTATGTLTVSGTGALPDYGYSASPEYLAP